MRVLAHLRRIAIAATRGHDGARVEPGECLNGCNVARLSLDDSMYDVARVGYDAFGLSDYLPYLINCLCRRELLLLS